MCSVSLCVLIVYFGSQLFMPLDFACLFCVIPSVLCHCLSLLVTFGGCLCLLALFVYMWFL